MTKPECLLKPDFIMGFVTNNSVFNAMMEKYCQKRKGNDVEQQIENRIVLNLPFDAEPSPSEDLLGHPGGFVCPMSKSPKGKNASRCLILTFKKKATTYTSVKKAKVRTSIGGAASPVQQAFFSQGRNKKRAGTNAPSMDMGGGP